MRPSLRLPLAVAAYRENPESAQPSASESSTQRPFPDTYEAPLAVITIEDVASALTVTLPTARVALSAIVMSLSVSVRVAVFVVLASLAAVSAPSTVPASIEHTELDSSALPMLFRLHEASTGVRAALNMPSKRTILHA